MYVYYVVIAGLSPASHFTVYMMFIHLTVMCLPLAKHTQSCTT